MRLKLMISAVALINFLDALTTYILVAGGKGVEVNPMISDVVNSDPAAVFIIHILATAAIAVLFAAADKISRRLPAATYEKVAKFAHLAFAISAVFRAAVVANNMLGIAVGVTPLADFFIT